MSANDLQNAINVLNKYWGYATFRPLQPEIIDSVLSGKDTLALLPTGGGKSICFQVPGLMMDGTCLVVSPLIALMKDQVFQLKKRGISAEAIYSGLSKREIDILLDNCIYGHIKFLYVSPERLKTELFLERAKKMKISFLAVDEAHCISQWGYDFRPPYLEIQSFKEEVGISKCMALTASATEAVKKDICEKLGFSSPAIFQKSFSRPNLSYSVFETEKKEDKLLQILSKVPGTSVVYVRSRRKTKEISQLLQKRGVSADHYHAGLPSAERDQKQESWISGKVRVIVSTNAFGMGIDKADVRSVIHLDLPPDLESYYQEAGRAGRDEKMAFAVLLFNQPDIDRLQEQIQLSYPGKKELTKVYNAVCNHFKIAVGSGAFNTFDFDYDRFTESFNLSQLTTYFALKKLESLGYFNLNEGFKQPSRIMFLASSQEVYAFQVANRHFDPILKVLLRAYGGELYSNFVVINEQAISSLMKLSYAEVKKQLSELHEAEIVIYEPKKEKPQLTFLKERVAESRLDLNQKWLNQRKELEWNKAQAVIQFARNHDKCRTLQIIHYFGELKDVKCGVCDVCIQEKKAHQMAEDTSFQRIKSLLNKHISLSPEEITIHFSSTEKGHVEQEIRNLLDYGVLKMDSAGKITLAARSK